MAKKLRDADANQNLLVKIVARLKSLTEKKFAIVVSLNRKQTIRLSTHKQAVSGAKQDPPINT